MMPGYAVVMVRLIFYIALFSVGMVLGVHWSGAQEQKNRADRIESDFAKYRQAVQSQLASNRKVITDYETKIVELDRRYRNAGSLRLPASVCEPAKGGSPGPTQTDAGTIALPESIEGSLFQLTRQADEIVEQCRALQEWVTLNK